MDPRERKKAASKIYTECALEANDRDGGITYISVIVKRHHWMSDMKRDSRTILDSPTKKIIKAIV